MNKILFTLGLVLSVFSLKSQNSIQPNFAEYQRNFPRFNGALAKREDSLIRQFREKGLEWPAKYLYIRSFKYDSQLEVWVKNEKDEPFKLFKTYKVCAMAGTLGPKRMEGDYQVPEGFYYINEFNPRSIYHLSLGLNYPNASDRFLSDAIQPGGDIYIHGSCVTTGCIPITDTQIEELYLMASYAKSFGQDFIPVHIFPVKFNNRRSSEYLNRYVRDFADYANLASSLKEVFYYFEKYKKLPVIMVNGRGSYVLDEDVKSALPSLEKKIIPSAPVIKKQRITVPFNEKDIPNTVQKLPEFPGGITAFKNYLRQLNLELAPFLKEDQHTAYILVEFIVDKNGKVLNPKILKGGNDQLNEYLLDALEQMPDWKPAVRDERNTPVNVPMKLKQTILVETKPEA
ncbi:L,D-transpeptidase family protein [Flavihumibacter profundi]|jgi:murein L,D-transpeptidase YafK|uniref:L,D-transpeptidase family protein n=1 Tax=Flavihumibacter profundi TaxID=2716883 RepID=UPI001CC53315|nr:L,D-transpeptidase family protein [Flavihumibacter profundi]MBZ5855873.1 L,D-transpeptidase family protein [Flavihumibacter profundi]